MSKEKPCWKCTWLTKQINERPCSVCDEDHSLWELTNKQETETLPSGGKQASEQDEFRYLDPQWLIDLSKGLTKGAEKYGVDNWRQIEAREHAWRAVRHLVYWAVGDRTEDHLLNASMRCMMVCVVARGDDK
jgi:hypothetical protein